MLKNRVYLTALLLECTATDDFREKFGNIFGAYFSGYLVISLCKGIC